MICGLKMHTTYTYCQVLRNTNGLQVQHADGSGKYPRYRYANKHSLPPLKDAIFGLTAVEWLSEDDRTLIWLQSRSDCFLRETYVAGYPWFRWRHSLQIRADSPA